ncbi:MAG: hypothetical protein ONA90_10410, partial [candidate division KSB1 bacterium]|nr:hypothetical protein [candidate division KSB1 bacterium]
MPKRSELPIEERNYSHIYFALSALLALTTFWAVLDMIWARAPWQREQRKFNDWEIAELQTKLAAAEEKFNTESAQRYQELQTQLAEARAQLTSESYRQAAQDSAAADLEAAKARQEYRFLKSEADAEYYLYKEAEYHNKLAEYKARGEKVASLNEKAAEWKAKWDAAEAKKHQAMQRLAELRKPVTDIVAEMKAMRAEIENLHQLIARVDDRPIKIKQVVMPAFVKGNFGNYIDNVDRCESCHPAATRKGFEHAEMKNFRTHPSLDTLLAIHPVERFGCSPCHGGQGPALQGVKYAHGTVKYWEHPLLKGEFLEAGCNLCHAKELLTDHAETLNEAKRMVYDLGCFGCHEIRGFETLERIGPSLNRITKKLDPSWVYGWLRNNREFRPHTRMPNPLYTHEEALATTAFLFSLEADNDWQPVKKTLAGNARRGEALVDNVGCKGCHVITEEDR